MSVRLLTAAAALSILIGAGVAYCQHQEDGPSGPEPVDCVGVMWAAPPPAPPRRPDFRKDPGPPRREARREPRGERRAPTARTTRPAPLASASPRARGPRADIDVEFGGC
ncbi:hypothetical protein ACKI16_29770 [Streptomyces scabiei]|uniref:hypothetical protein n=1 Tax=Streptomyces scabiei TaxID=1930 RepID=UPI0038F68F4E